MATPKKRYRRSKPVHFNSVELHNMMLAEAYKELPRWFDSVSFSDREEFALKYGTKTWNVSPTGNPTSVVVSYPQPKTDGRRNVLSVKVYDLDAGEMFWVPLARLTRQKISGRAMSYMYEYGTVYGDELRCESEDIVDNIDWESLREWDKNNGRKRTEWDKWQGGGPMFNANVRKLISLPKGIKVIY